MGIRIVLAENEPIGLALKRFKKLVERGGILHEQRKRVAYINGTEKRRRKEFRKRYWTNVETNRQKAMGIQPVKQS